MVVGVSLPGLCYSQRCSYKGDGTSNAAPLGTVVEGAGGDQNLILGLVKLCRPLEVFHMLSTKNINVFHWGFS